MADPRDPDKKTPLTPPGSLPEPPIEEPEPDRLPDEAPTPNPDETRNPPAYLRPSVSDRFDVFCTGGGMPIA